MGLWTWIAVIIVVLVVIALIGRRGGFGRGYSDDHAADREAHRQRFDNPRGNGPSL